MKSATEASEEEVIRESINPPCVVYIDTGKRDSEGRRIFKNLGTGQEQVFDDEEEAFSEE